MIDWLPNELNSGVGDWCLVFANVLSLPQWHHQDNFADTDAVCWDLALGLNHVSLKKFLKSKISSIIYYWNYSFRVSEIISVTGIWDFSGGYKIISGYFLFLTG